MGWKRNKMTGEVAWFDDGTTPIPIGPRNPAKQAVNDMQPEQMRGQIASTATNIQGQQIDNRVKDATAGAMISKADSDARRSQFEAAAAERDFKRGPKLSDAEIKVQDERRGRLSALNQLASQIDRVDSLYREGPGATSGLGSLKDYIPTPGNERFDAAGALLSQMGLAAFRTPGTGTVSDRDAMMFDRAALPQASNFDSATEEQIRGLRARVNEEMQSLGQAPRWNDKNQPVLDNQRTLDAARARLEQQIANLPPQAQAIGRQNFYANPAIKRLMGTRDAPRENAIDFNKWGSR